MNYWIQITFDASNFVKRHWTQEKGATATEYSILAGFIALVIVAGIGAFGIALNGVFGNLAAGIQVALGIP